MKRSSNRRALSVVMIAGTAFFFSCKKGGSKATDAAQPDGEKKITASEEGEGDSGNGEGETPDHKKIPPATDGIELKGRVSSLAIDAGGGIATALTVTAFAVGEDGKPGAELASTALAADGSFTLPMSAQAGMVQLAIEPTGLGLTSSAPVVRAVLKNVTSSKSVSVNEITELSVRRLDARLSGGESISDALKLSAAEATALTGVKDVSGVPQGIDAEDGSVDAYRYDLFLSAIDKRRMQMSGEASAFLEALLADAEDGSINGKSGSEFVTVGGKPIIRQNFGDEMRVLMKNVVAEKDSVIGFNDIQVLDGGFASTISMHRTNGTLDEYEPVAPTVFEHWIDFDYDAEMSLDYPHSAACIGPIQVKRLDDRGRALNAGPALPVSVTGDDWTIHSASSCDNGSLIAGSITIPENESHSSEFYVTPVKFSYSPIMGVVSTSDVPKVDYAFLPFLPHYNGKLIANTIHIDVFSGTDGGIRTWQPVGQFGSELQRDQCYPAAAILTCGGMFCREQGVFPTNLNLTMGLNKGANVTGDVKLYEDAACTDELGISMVLPAGVEHKSFYVKTTSDFSNFASMFRINANGLYGVSWSSGNIYFVND